MKPRLLFVTLGVLALAVYSKGQQTTQPTAPLTVKVSFSVIDGSGRAVNDLKIEDIQVFDRGSPVNVQSLAKETAPVMYGLVVDRSGSLKLHFSNIIDVAKQIIAANEANDQTFLVSFVNGDKMNIVQEVTSNTAALVAGLTTLKVEGGQTALIDAVYLSAQYAMKHQSSDMHYRLALVLLTDGEERSSYYREEQLMQLLDKSKIQVFVVALVTDLEDDSGFIRQSRRQKATDVARRLGEKSRGDAFILKSPKELADATRLLTTELHSQYVLGYNPTRNIDKDNRKVEIKLTKSPQHEKWRLVVGNVTTEAQK